MSRRARSSPQLRSTLNLGVSVFVQEGQPENTEKTLRA